MERPEERPVSIFARCAESIEIRENEEPAVVEDYEGYHAVSSSGHIASNVVIT
jgi:hypothetical protein